MLLALLQLRNITLFCSDGRTGLELPETLQKLYLSSQANANYKHQEVFSTNQRIRVKLFLYSRKSPPRRWHHLFAGVPTQPPLMIDGEL